mmetsp:Transcript_117694/g.340265  ORF Transcript_117694/g.340265 Transcript_117694/m.340265 type:complete len:247 (-) Transcript_117694:591-1331(-)
MARVASTSAGRLTSSQQMASLIKPRLAPRSVRIARSRVAARTPASSASERTTSGQSAWRRARRAPTSSTRSLRHGGSAKRSGTARPVRGTMASALRRARTAGQLVVARTPACSAMRRTSCGLRARPHALPARTSTRRSRIHGRAWSLGFEQKALPHGCRKLVPTRTRIAPKRVAAWTATTSASRRTTPTPSAGRNASQASKRTLGIRLGLVSPSACARRRWRRPPTRRVSSLLGSPRSAQARATTA